MCSSVTISHAMSWTKAGQDLKRWREDAGLTQQQLSDRLDIAVSTISRIENATDDRHPNTKESNLRRLARAMGPAGPDFLREVGVDPDGVEDEIARMRTAAGPHARRVLDELDQQDADVVVGFLRDLIDEIRERREEATD